MGTQLYLPKRAEPPKLSAHICCSQWLDGSRCHLVGQHCVMETQLPSPKKGTGPPIFIPCLLWPNGWMDWIQVSLGTEVGLGPGDVVLDGDPAPGWIKMPLSTAVHCRSRPGCIVLDGDPALPSQKRRHRAPNFRPMSIVAKRLNGGGAGSPSNTTWPVPKPTSTPSGILNWAQPPIFGPYLLWPNGWIDQDTTWYRCRPRPRRRCVRWGPSSFPLKRTQPPVFGSCLLWPNGWIDEDVTWYGSRPMPRPHCVRRGPGSAPRKGYNSPLFRPMSIVVTVAHLSHC